MQTIRFREDTLLPADHALARFLAYVRRYPRAHPSADFITSRARAAAPRWPWRGGAPDVLASSPRRFEKRTGPAWQILQPCTRRAPCGVHCQYRRPLLASALLPLRTGGDVREGRVAQRAFDCPSSDYCQARLAARPTRPRRSDETLA